MNTGMSGLLFDIQGYSVHDGSGCRTAVFFSGCPLHCSWCANPEGLLLRPRRMFQERRCDPHCRRCVEACLNDGVRKTSELCADRHDQAIGGLPEFDRAICDRCDAMPCVNACLKQALPVSGRAYTVDELMRVLTRDQGYWGSQGGVTFSGGEPLLQGDFLLAVLRECRAHYMHTAVETSAHAVPATLRAVLEYIDWMFVDIKHMDSAAHAAETGVGNELILKNIQTTVSSGWPGRLIIRVPIIPSFNDGEDNLQATADFIAGLKLKEVNLLPFHRLGHSKYEQLGLPYKYAKVMPPSKDALQAQQHVFESVGLRSYIGGETPF